MDREEDRREIEWLLKIGRNPQMIIIHMIQKRHPEWFRFGIWGIPEGPKRNDEITEVEREVARMSEENS